MLRTPLARYTHVLTARDLTTSLVESGIADPAAFADLTDNESRHLTVQALLDRAPFHEALLQKDFALFEPVGANRFWISDHPVILGSTAPYGDLGLASPGVGIYMPVGPTLVVGLICKSIAITLNARLIEQLELEPELAAHYIAVREGVRGGQPIPWTDDQVGAFNVRQIASGSLHLFT